MSIIFARHGNTFGPGEKAVWVGRETDLALVEKGEAQAHAAAGALSARPPAVIYAASLKRTRRFADIVAGDLGLPAPVVDDRLDEVHYGAWAGRTNDEIAALGPEARIAMEGWGQRDAWPDQAGWGCDRQETMAAIAAFAEERLAAPPAGPVLVVSSNGILRFLPRLLLGGQPMPDSFKMRTGHLGLIEGEGGRRRLAGWDLAPDAFAQLLKSA